MNLLSFFKRPASAGVARERLQLMLAHEKTGLGKSNLLTVLREEILAVIAKHMDVDGDKVQVKLDHNGAVSTLEVDIEIPNSQEAVAA
jgi:cell division topological specificity factor